MVEAIVKFDFNGRSPEELTIRRTDLVKVLRTKSEVETYWYFAETNGRIGLVPENHIEMKPHNWFCELLTRKDAENFLEDKETGNFIIRHAESTPTLGSYSLSVKYDEKVKHFKITRDPDGTFLIWLRKFKTLNDLVNFHSSHSISKTQNVKLVEIAPALLPIPEYQADIEYNPHLIKEEGLVAATVITTTNVNVNASTDVKGVQEGLSLLDISGQDLSSTEDAHYKSPLHSSIPGASGKIELSEMKLVNGSHDQVQPSSSRVSSPSEITNHNTKATLYVQALYDFQAEEKDELGFKKGQIIKVTNKDDDHWWQGQIQDRHGQFPSSHIILYEPRI